MITITIAILLLTCVISFTAFSNNKVMEDLIFYPPSIHRDNQWYRFISSGFIHADFMHLAFNMYTFYMFGDIVERAFTEIFGNSGKIFYIILYLTSLVVCLLPTYLHHKDNFYYRSLGASGAVSAIIFTGIFLYPTMGLALFPIPFHVPAFIFGPIYLLISAYLAKRGQGNINHSAHIWGALFGIVFLILTCTFFTNFKPLENFVSEVLGYFR